MKRVNIKADIGGKLKQACDNLSEKQRKGVLIGMLVISTILYGITVTRAFGRILSHGTQKELPLGGPAPADSLHRADKDSMMYHPKKDE